MAENRISSSSEVLQKVQLSKKGRNFSDRNLERIRKRLTKSPKRAGTPEPEKWVLTDDSEKDMSDGENIKKKNVNEEVRGQNVEKKRFTIHKNKVDLNRSRSLENTLIRETDSDDDDFERIRSLHKSKQQEEEKKEAEKLKEDSKPRLKEELKEFVSKEMPPLIMAPKDSKKRKRHKSLPLQEDLQVQEKLKTPILKSKKKIIKSKIPILGDENFSSFQRGSTTTPTTEEFCKLRTRKTIKIGQKENKVELDVPINEKLTVESKKEEYKTLPEKKLWFYQKWFSRGEVSNKKTEDKRVKEEGEKSTREKIQPKKIDEKSYEKNRWILMDIFDEWKLHVYENQDYCKNCRKLKNRCLTDLIILFIFCGFGGMIFRFTEGAFESFYKCGVKRVKRDFVDTLWKNSQYMLEDEWKSQARRKLMDFENQLHSAHEAGMTTYSGQKSWSFLNAVVYCLTVVTTIGYGHISPSTTTGRAITIIYAIFGIPMFLILLADFGKLFTRGIKFLWAFVRRLYYTGSCRKVRKTAPVQEVMKGVQIMYDFAKTRRLTIAGGMEGQEHHLRPPEPIQVPETPGTPNWSVYEINDEFNLPISIAISILLTYIFFGAFLYWMWEDWSFFESFYFVFISMSTIGFGDFVPQHPIYMMLSIVYLIFGLALTSMSINVVQEKLSDTFRQASAKLGTTMGLNVEESVIVPQNGAKAEDQT